MTTTDRTTTGSATRAITKRLRYEILRRDDHTCRYCGAKAADSPLTVDHVIPKALGGSSDPTNLVAACVDCNAGKTSTLPDARTVEGAAEDAVRWAKAVKEAASLLAAEREEQDSYVAYFRECWDHWRYTNAEREGQAIDLPSNWRGSIEQFHEKDLSREELAYAVATAMGAHVWRSEFPEFKYFCGVAHNILKRRDALALELVRKAA